MKKSFLILGFILLSLFLTNVNAESSSVVNSPPSLTITGQNLPASSLTPNLTLITTSTQDSLANATNVSWTSLDKIVIPSVITDIMKLVFNLPPDTSITVQELIIILALWIMLFSIIWSVLELIPIFGKGAKSIIGSIVITLLMSITGALNTTYLLLWGLLNAIKVLDRLQLLRFILALGILLVFFLSLRIIIKIIKNKVGVLKSEITGFKQGLK